MGLITTLTSYLLHELTNLGWHSIPLFIFLFWIYKEVSFQIRRVKVPIIGCPFPGWLGTWIGGIWFIFYGQDVVRKAYMSRKHSVFQVAMIERMLVVVTTNELIDQVCHAPVEELSFMKAIDEDFQVTYTMSREVHDNIFHIGLIREKLTTKLWKTLDVMEDEIKNACHHHLGRVKGETIEVNAMEIFLDILTRLSNRYFVGTPMCREPKYLESAKAYAKDVAISGFFIRLWPSWLKPLASMLCSSIPYHQKVAMEYLEPILKQRKQGLEIHGRNWRDRPDDYIQWIVEGSIKEFGNCDDFRDIMLRLMFLNFAGNHTSAQTFCMVLFQLVNRPEYIEPIRQEAMEMIRLYGYTTKAFGKMSKMDSFTRECSRYVSLGPIVNTRTAKVPVTLRDGTLLPPGTQVCMPHHSVHNDPNISLYKDPNFNGFRFHNHREELAGKVTGSVALDQAFKTELWTSTSNHQLFFGNGRHPCPGRFFASLQSKMVLHYLLTNYEMEADPKSNYNPHRFQTMYIPNTKAIIKLTRITDPEPGVMSNDFLE